MTAPAGKKKLPVVEAGGGKRDAAPARAGKVAVSGWGAFTEGGTVPGWMTAARAVMVLALCATFPMLLGIEHGNRVLWTMLIASIPLFIVLGGFHLWRRICPLAVIGQLGRLVGRPGTRKVGEWLGERYLLLQFGLLVVGMSFRLVATNGSGAWLAGFLLVVAVVAAVVSFVFAGKTWCNFLCPVGTVEKIYTEPSRLAGSFSSQCGPCVACKKHCPDIDLEGGYWKEAEGASRRLVYFAWPGVVVGFYTYFWMVAGTWDYYFSGGWAYETDLPARWLDPGFFFAPLDVIPRVAAAPLTLVAFGAASWLVFHLGERLALRRALAGLDAASQAANDAATRVRHRALVLAGFAGFNCFYFFAGQPSLQRLPEWVVRGVGLVVVLASAAIFFRRWGRTEADHVQEKFAQKILKKWEWGDAPPSNDLQDIYLLHTERTKQREARLRAYKETVRELVADGVVTRSELVILDSLRAQLGISDKDHQKVVNELSEEERQLFDPSYQGSVEQRLKGQQYRRDLERLVMDAGRNGGVPSAESLEALRQEHGVSEAEAQAELDRMYAVDGPVLSLVRAETAALERLAALAAAAHASGADASSESSTLAFARYLAAWRGAQHVHRALGLVAATLERTTDGLARRRAVEAARQALAARPGALREQVAALRGHLDDAVAVAMLAAVESLCDGRAGALEPAPLLAVAADGSPYLRATVALLLSRFDDDASRAALLAAMGDPEPLVREAAVRALGSRRRLTRELLTQVLDDADPRVRHAAVRAVAGSSTAARPVAIDPAVMAQTTRGVGGGGHATLDANAAMDSLTTVERMMLLRNVPMFAALTPPDLEELSAVVVEQGFQPGELLFGEGDAGDGVYVVVRGRVEVFTGLGDGARKLSELGDGACIGEMAVLDEAPRSASVRAVERTRSLVIPGAGFKDLLSTRPEMSQAILAELVRRMRGMMQAR